MSEYNSTLDGADIDAAVDRVLNNFEFPSKTQAELDGISLDAGDRHIYYNSTTASFVRWDGTAFIDFANVRTSTAGNARGTGAVDFQYSRSADSQVASGTRACIAGGRENTASGTYSLTSGRGNTTSGEGSVAHGRSNVASGEGAVATGGYNTASGDQSSAGGYESDARLPGARAQAYKGFDSVAGSAQRVELLAWIETSNATPTACLIGGTTPIVVEDDKTYAAKVVVVGKNTGADESAAYTVRGVLTRGTGAAATALLGTAEQTIHYETAAAWDATLAADVSNGALQVTVTGEAGKTIRWVAFVEWVEVGL